MKDNKDTEVTRKKNTIPEDAKKLVIARLNATSSDLRLVVGAMEYSKEELIKSIEEETDLGKEIVAIQLEYLRDMANGAIYQNG